jgi:WD40 repeat protein
LFPFPAIRSREVRTIQFTAGDQQLIVGAKITPSKLGICLHIGVITNLTNFANWIGLADVSPDGKTLVVPSADHKLRLFDTTTWQETRTLRGHADEVWAAAFSPDGKVIASSGKDGTVRLWELTDPQKPPTFRAWPFDSFKGWALSPAAETLLTIEKDGSYYYRLWDTARLQGMERRPLFFPIPVVGDSDTDTKELSHAALSPGGKFLVLANQNHSLTIWDNPNQVKVTSPDQRPGGLAQLTFSTDGAMLAAVRGNQCIELWPVRPLDVADCSRPFLWPHSFQRFRCLARRHSHKHSNRSARTPVGISCHRTNPGRRRHEAFGLSLD